ncbi:hypothetical protein SNK04_014120 [Fusarium graminearum]
MSDTSIPNNGGQGGNEGGEGGQGGAPSLLNQGVGNDWLPEKFRTVKEGGSDLDLEASSRKLAASYAELEKSRAVGTVPKSAEEYVIDGMPEGVNVDEVKSDPLFKGILGRAHEAGIPQEHVNFFLKEYFGFAPTCWRAIPRSAKRRPAPNLAKPGATTKPSRRTWVRRCAR